MTKEIINCPTCKGRGGFTYERKMPIWQKVATLGFGNFLDEEWDEECERCDGHGKIKVNLREEND